MAVARHGVGELVGLRGCWVWRRRLAEGGVSRRLSEACDWSDEAWWNSPVRFHIHFPALGYRSHSPLQVSKSIGTASWIVSYFLFIYIFVASNANMNKQNLTLHYSFIYTFVLHSSGVLSVNFLLVAMIYSLVSYRIYNPV